MASMYRLYLSIILTICATFATYAQQTGLYTYDGGFFIKNGNEWREYRPNDKSGVWNTYTQYNQEANYYQIKNSLCKLSIPRNTNCSFYILKNGEWEKIYRTREIYSYFNDKSTNIYCYKGGYFVRDGQTWREYRPNDKQGLWAEYNQYDVEKNYFRIKNTSCKVCVPKQSNNSFYISSEDGSWKPIYTTIDIYDTYAGSTNFDFVINFMSYKTTVNDEFQTFNEAAHVGINRDGTGEIFFQNKTYPFKFTKIAIMTIRGSDEEIGFRINLESEYFIAFMYDWCMVNAGGSIPFADLLECTDKSTITTIQNLIRAKTFFK